MPVGEFQNALKELRKNYLKNLTLKMIGINTEHLKNPVTGNRKDLDLLKY